jgi:hypothetical protein
MSCHQPWPGKEAKPACGWVKLIWPAAGLAECAVPSRPVLSPARPVPALNPLFIKNLQIQLFTLVNPLPSSPMPLPLPLLSYIHHQPFLKKKKKKRKGTPNYHHKPQQRHKKRSISKAAVSKPTLFGRNINKKTPIQQKEQTLADKNESLKKNII